MASWESTGISCTIIVKQQLDISLTISSAFPNIQSTQSVVWILQGGSINTYMYALRNNSAKGTDGIYQCIILGCVDAVYDFDIVKFLALQKKGAHE